MRASAALTTVLAAALGATLGMAPAQAGGDLDFGDPKPAERMRPAVRSDIAPPAPRTTPTLVARPSAPTAPPPPRATEVTPPAAPQPRVDGRPASVTTAAISPARPPAPSADDLQAVLIGQAEREQARLDLIKLELALRTYNEPRLSGQAAFDTRPHWRILERGRDAFSSTELAAAEATGFEANVYINDRDRMIVVAVAGTQDLKRDLLTAGIWDALIQAQAPQHFFMAKSYIRSVILRYQAQGYSTECVGHSLGGGACAYAAAELGIRAIVVNPISAGRLPETAHRFITNYIVDGDIAQRVYEWRGNPISGDIQHVKAGREDLKARLKDRYGPLYGPILVVRELQNAVRVHSLDRALDLIAAQTGAERIK